METVSADLKTKRVLFKVGHNIGFQRVRNTRENSKTAGIMELGVSKFNIVFFWPTGVKHYGEFEDGEITGTGVRYRNLLFY